MVFLWGFRQEMPVLAYAVETYAQVINEIKPLLEAHWHEIAHFKDSIKFSPNYAIYESLFAKRGLLICTARDSDNSLCGYSIFFLIRHPHYKDDIQAVNDIIYLKPELRGKAAGGHLIQFSEAMAKEWGARWITWHVKDHFNFGPHLANIGYSLIEHTYGKIL
jgi:GNAT superfamily N-acetyltransferase